MLALARTTKPSHAEESQAVFVTIRPALIYGAVIITVILLFFGLWAGFAPLDSAAIANGSVVLSANRKTIQHLEGGIIEKIMVKEGDDVAADQPLIYLNATSAHTRHGVLLAQLRVAKATQIRLFAERDERAKLNFNDALFTQPDQKTQALLNSQRKLFSSKQASLHGQIEVLKQRIIEYQQQIIGLDEQAKQMQRRISLLTEEIDSTQYLLKRGFEEKPHLLLKQRKLAELQSEVAKNKADIATTKGNISEARLKILDSQQEYLKDVMTELKDTQQQIADLEEKNANIH